jgi:uncharacterized membrane protein YoaK (UPF0700 family)
MKEALYVVIAAGVVAFFIVRQRRSDRFRERSLLIPLALGVYGAVLLTQTSEHDSLTTASAVLLLSSAAASIVFGVIRGLTIELFMRGDELWERATWTTIGLGWGGLVVTRIGLIVLAAALGAKVASSPASIPIMLAVTLAAQMLVVKARAREIGVVAEPSPRRLRRKARRS